MEIKGETWERMIHNVVLKSIEVNLSFLSTLCGCWFWAIKHCPCVLIRYVPFTVAKIAYEKEQLSKTVCPRFITDTLLEQV